jgi:hypothetical protein
MAINYKEFANEVLMKNYPDEHQPEIAQGMNEISKKESDKITQSEFMAYSEDQIKF